MTTPAAISGYTTGYWIIDPNNSDISFTVRYLGVSKVHGRFKDVSGEIVTADTVDKSRVSASIIAGSIDTGFEGRNEYIKGGDVLDVEAHKELTFVSTGIRSVGAGYFVDGDLTIRGVSRAVTLTANIGGFASDPGGGGPVLGISATTTLGRADFGLSEKVPAAIIGDKITIRLDIHARRGVDTGPQHR
jgi:polyisoprenoid-binding protein YceI